MNVVSKRTKKNARKSIKKERKPKLTKDEKEAREKVLLMVRNTVSQAPVEIWSLLGMGGERIARVAGAASAVPILSALSEVEQFTPSTARAMAAWMLEVSSWFSLWADDKERAGIT